MSKELVLQNARVVSGGEVLRGSVCVRDGIIAAVDADMTQVRAGIFG